MNSQNDLEKVFKNFYGKYILYNETNESDSILSGNILEISKANYKDLHESSLLISEFNFFKRKVEEIKMNYHSVINCENYWSESLSLVEGHKVNSYHERVYIDFNRKLTNFLVSLKTLINDLILIRKLPKIFGKGSQEVENFRNITREWYDKYFEYRFLFRLRDFAVHVDFPINSVKFDYNYDETKEPKRTLVINATFVKSHLLSNIEFESKLKNDLKLYNSTFPVSNLLKNIDFIFDEILKAIIQISGKRYINAAEVLNHYFYKIPSPKSVSFGTIYEDGPNTRLINIDAVNYINSISKSKDLKKLK